MRRVLKHRALKLIFAANVISMIGSGMNSAAVTWYVLQATHSETALGTLLMLQTIPAMLLLPFSGVVIDREDRRRLVMILDALRGIAILTVAILAWRGMAKLWEVYLLSIFVAAGFWMFWPTMNALIQELTPESEFVHANSFIVAGYQGGWLIAGALVGFIYNWIGLGGILFIDAASYALSFACYLFVRKGRHTVRPAASEHLDMHAVDRYFHELREGIAYVRKHTRVLLLGLAWAFFTAGMFTQGLLTAPFSDRMLKAGAVGYGWLNGGWAVGACSGAFLSSAMIRRIKPHRAVTVSMALIGTFLMLQPTVGTHLHGSFQTTAALSVGFALLVSVLMYSIMGSGRAVGGVALTSTIMEMVPSHFMGRVQNTFYFVGTVLQFALALAIGTVAHNKGLAFGFYIVGSLYLAAAVASSLPARDALEDQEAATSESQEKAEQSIA